MERIVFGHFFLYANQYRKSFDQDNFYVGKLIGYFLHTTERNSQLINELKKEFMNQTGHFFLLPQLYLLLCSFECQTSKKMDRYAQVAMLQLEIINHRLFKLDYEVQARQRRGSNDSGSGHGYPQTEGFNLDTTTNYLEN